MNNNIWIFLFFFCCYCCIVIAVSDDNSSIQSSPWQPERSLKQPSPRKNISKDLNLSYYRPVPIVLSEKSKTISKRIRRQPHSKKYEKDCVEYAKRVGENVENSADDKKPDTKMECKNEMDEDKENEANGKMETEDTVDGSVQLKDEPMPSAEGEQMEIKTSESNSKDDEPNNDTKTESRNNDDSTKNETKIKCFKKRLIRSAKIGTVIEKLITKVSEQPVNVSTTQTGPGFHLTSSSRSNDLLYPHQHVSPRKRILREFEKVSLEDRNSTNLKRSRSKSNTSSDSPNRTVVTQHTVSIANSNKDDHTRFTNGSQSPLKRSSPTDVSRSESAFKHSKVPSTTSSANSQTISTNESAPPTVSKPLSNYSIKSLLGHNNTSSDKYENNDEKPSTNDARGSPRSPHSYNHQSLASNRSSFLTKKRSPTNNSASTLMHSPVNYRNSPRSPNNSPSPGPQQNSHSHRFQHNSHPASISSPTSGFHPYLASARVSPLSSGTLSPPDMYRHRSYRTACSPSTISNSSGGLSHSYASLNSSPTAFANRYSPSTYSNSSSSMKTSPTQSSHSQNLSSAFAVSNLLPQSNDSSSNNERLSHNYSPNLKTKSNDWSPAKTSIGTPNSAQNSPSSHTTNSISATTIPKKTASIRQKYESHSPNGIMNANHTEHTKSDGNSARKSLNDNNAYEAKASTKRSRSPTDFIKKHQQQELYEKNLQAQYNAELARQQSFMSALQQPPVGNPFYNIYHAAAYAQCSGINPYYHPNDLLRKTHPSELLHKNIPPHSWIDPYTASLMHYSGVGSGLISDKNSIPKPTGGELHSMLMSPYGLAGSSAAHGLTSAADVEMWRASEKKAPESPTPSAFRRQSQPSYNDCEPISLIKDEQSSGNLTITFMIKALNRFINRNTSLLFFHSRRSTKFIKALIIIG